MGSVRGSRKGEIVSGFPNTSPVPGGDWLPAPLRSYPPFRSQSEMKEHHQWQQRAHQIDRLIVCTSHQRLVSWLRLQGRQLIFAIANAALILNNYIVQYTVAANYICRYAEISNAPATEGGCSPPAQTHHHYSHHLRHFFSIYFCPSNFSHVSREMQPLLYQ